MNQLVKSPEEMANALALASQTIAQESPGQNDYLKLNKVGYWIFGQDDLEVTEDALWGINTHSFSMGYICWKADNTLGAPLGEKMMSIYTGAVKESDLEPIPNGKWVRQVAMQLVCLEGEDKGEQALYQSSTMGGTKAFGLLLEQIMKHLQSGKAGKKTMPVLELESDSYKNKGGIEVFFPIFTIKKWLANIGFDAVEEVEEEEEEEVVEPVKRKRAQKKRAATKPVEVVDEEEVDEEEVDEEEEKEVEPEEVQPARRRRRRK